MGEGVWGGIVKGPVHRFVDAYLNQQTNGVYDKRQEFLDKVKAAANADDYLTYLKSLGLKTGDADYLRTWWYNEGPTGFWPWLQPIYPVLKAGLIKAIEVAIATRRPLDSYWSSSGHQVEVFVTQSPFQITRLIVTPWTIPPVNLRTQQADTWMVRRGLGSLTPGDPSDDKKSAVVETVTGSVVVWRVWDLPDEPTARRRP